MSFIADINGYLTTATLFNGALIGVNTGSNGTLLSNFKGSVMAVLTAPTAIGSAPCNYNVRLLSHTNADQNVGAVVAQFTLVTNGGPSTQRVAIDPRACNAYLSAQVNVAGTNINAYPIVTVFGYDTTQA